MIALEWPEDLAEVGLIDMPYSHLLTLKNAFDARKINLVFVDGECSTTFNVHVFEYDGCGYRIVTSEGSKAVITLAPDSKPGNIKLVEQTTSLVCSIALTEWCV